MGAFVCGIISSVITILSSGYALIVGKYSAGGMQISAYTLVDAVIMIGLTIGIHFKSRICATIFAIYWLWNKYMFWKISLDPASYLVGMVFLFFYVQGALGTFAYHKQKAASAQSA